ncbi:MAG: glycosyltransferase family 39 protein [Candidatus Nanohaloarchaea archaeon]
MIKQLPDEAIDWLHDNRAFSAVITVFAIGQLAIIAEIWTDPLIWDTAIYWGMGKALFSGNQVGLWEVFRPPFLPAVLGALWKLGMPAEGFTRLLSLIISITGLTGIYLMLKDLASKKIALYTASLTAASFTFVYYTNMLLTGITASFLVFTSLYLAAKNRMLLAGLVGGLAFLTRFPSALVGPAAVIFILYRYRGQLLKAVQKSALYSTGFFSLALSYMAANKYFFGSFLEPFIRGFAIPASTANTYLYGLFYFLNGVKINPFLILMPLGLYIIVKRRKMELYGFGAALVLFYGFFTLFPRKEVRFILLFLPLMALAAAQGLNRVLSRVEVERKELAVLGLVFLVMLVGLSVTFGQKRGVNEDRVEYYRAHSGLEGVVAANDASILPYGDIKYFPLPPATLESSYDQARDRADYFSINSCAWYCTPGNNDCKQEIREFEQDLSMRYDSIYQNHGPNCNYTIYRVK